LAGSEPGHWFDDPKFDYDEADPRSGVWRDAVVLFHRTGAWLPGRTCGVCGRELLLSAPAGDPLCIEHHASAESTGEYPSSWPSVVTPEPSESLRWG
jgi:hypothetical protein